MLKPISFSKIVSPLSFKHPAILIQHHPRPMPDSSQVTMHSQHLAKINGDVVLEVLELFEIGQASKFVEAQHLQVDCFDAVDLEGLDVDALIGH